MVESIGLSASVMDVEDLAIQYLEKFGNKDLEGIAEFFSSSVKLRDWDLSAEGKDEVLDVNRKIFESFEEIGLEILRVISCRNKAVAEFSIKLKNDFEEICLLVVDIIEFTDNGLISEIKAYRGN